MPSRFIDIPIAVDAQVELLTVEHQAFVQCGKQYILSFPETVHRNSEEPVIASCIAGHDRGVAIRACLVR